MYAEPVDTYNNVVKPGRGKKGRMKDICNGVKKENNGTTFEELKKTMFITA